MNVVFTSHFAIDTLHIDPVVHNKHNFNRECAKLLADKIVESSCLLTVTEYDIQTQMYHTSVSVLVGRKERVLP